VAEYKRTQVLIMDRQPDHCQKANLPIRFVTELLQLLIYPVAVWRPIRPIYCMQQ
jgi:hypothetical protein